MLTVLHYDRDSFRISKNASMISEAFPKGIELKLVNVSRWKPFKGESCIIDLLLEDPLPFDVVIVNDSSLYGREVLEEVKAGLELNSLSLSRLNMPLFRVL